MIAMSISFLCNYFVCSILVLNELTWKWEAFPHFSLMTVQTYDKTDSYWTLATVTGTGNSRWEWSPQKIYSLTCL